MCIDVRSTDQRYNLNAIETNIKKNLITKNTLNISSGIVTS